MQITSKVLSLKDITFIGETTGDQFHSTEEFLLSGQKAHEIFATLTMKEANGQTTNVFHPEVFQFKTSSDTQTLSMADSIGRCNTLKAA